MCANQKDIQYGASKCQQTRQNNPKNGQSDTFGEECDEFYGNENSNYSVGFTTNAGLRAANRKIILRRNDSKDQSVDSFNEEDAVIIQPKSPEHSTRVSTM